MAGCPALKLQLQLLLLPLEFSNPLAARKPKPAGIVGFTQPTDCLEQQIPLPVCLSVRPFVCVSSDAFGCFRVLCFVQKQSSAAAAVL